MIENVTCEFIRDKRKRHAAYLAELGWHRGPLKDLNNSLSALLDRAGITPLEPSISLDWLHSVVVRTMELADSVSCLHRGLGNDWCSNFDGGTDGIEWLRALAKTQQAFVFTPNWGSIIVARRIKKHLSDLTRYIESETGIHIERQHPANPYEIFAGGFELVPTFGLFPVYLLDERRSSWDVVPFAHQTKVSIMAHVDAVGEMFAGDEDTWSNGRTLRKPELNTLINATHSFQGARIIYRGPGHAAFKILLNQLAPKEYFLFRKKLRSIADFEIKELRRTEPTAEPVSESALIYKHLPVQGDGFCLFVADCGDQCLQDLKTLHPNNVVIWNVEHDLHIPVGVGFSLASIPLLLAKPKLLTALTKATQALLDDRDLKDALGHEGLGTIAAPLVSFSDSPIPSKNVAVFPPLTPQRVRQRLDRLAQKYQELVDYAHAVYTKKGVTPKKVEAEKITTYRNNLVQVHEFLLHWEGATPPQPDWIETAVLPQIDRLEAECPSLGGAKHVSN